LLTQTIWCENPVLHKVTNYFGGSFAFPPDVELFKYR
jgi:hypothetical protein